MDLIRPATSERWHASRQTAAESSTTCTVERLNQTASRHPSMLRATIERWIDSNDAGSERELRGNC
jgi:hypothetical protein